MQEIKLKIRVFFLLKNNKNTIRVSENKASQCYTSFGFLHHSTCTREPERAYKWTLTTYVYTVSKLILFIIRVRSYCGFI